MTPFRFQTTRSILSEAGATYKIGEILAASGCLRIALITDQTILDLGIAEAAIKGCRDAGLSPQWLSSVARSASRWRAQRMVPAVPRRQPRSEHLTPSRRKEQTRLEPPASASFARRAWKRGTSRTVSALDQECHCARRSQLLRWAASWRARVDGRQASMEAGQVC